MNTTNPTATYFAQPAPNGGFFLFQQDGAKHFMKTLRACRTYTDWPGYTLVVLDKSGNPKTGK